jgi:hypothetical protein
MEKYTGTFGDLLNSKVVSRLLGHILKNPHDSYTTKISEKFHYPLGVTATYLSTMLKANIIKNVRVGHKVYYFVDFKGLAKLWEKEAFEAISKEDTQKRRIILKITNHKRFPEFLFHYLFLHYAERKDSTLKDLLISWFFDGLFLDIKETKKGDLSYYFDELQSLFFSDNDNVLKMNQALEFAGKGKTMDFKFAEKITIQEIINESKNKKPNH